MEDGTLYRATKPGGKIIVSDDHARDINKLRGNGEGGLINALFHEYGAGAVGGRVCPCSRTIWHDWTKVCPKCGQETKPR